MARYTAEQLISMIEELTESRLEYYIRQQMIRPVISDAGEIYHDVDYARAQLLCRLSEDYRLEGDALSLVLSVLDEMHGLRGDMMLLMSALAEEPDEIRRRITLRVRKTQS